MRWGTVRGRGYRRKERVWETLVGGGERRYLGVCSDGFRRRWVDREDDGGYAEKKGRKNASGGASENEGRKNASGERVKIKVEKMRRESFIYIYIGVREKKGRKNAWSERSG